MVGRFAVNGVADAGARLVVFDPRRAAAEVTERERALVRMEEALTKLAAGLNQGRLKTLAAAQKKLTALRARHGLAAKYVVIACEEKEGVLTLTWRRDEPALVASAGRDGRWPLVTNRSGLSDAALCEWAVRRYKGHGRIERDQHLLKGVIKVRPLFVQNDDRIRGLVMICLWALTAWTLLERGARAALPPAPPRKPLPSIVRVEGMIHGITVVTLRVGCEGHLQRTVTPLHPKVQSLLHGLGLAREVRAILDDAVQMRSQV